MNITIFNVLKNKINLHFLYIEILSYFKYNIDYKIGSVIVHLNFLFYDTFLNIKL